eukprot:gene16987-23260_t
MQTSVIIRTRARDIPCNRLLQASCAFLPVSVPVSRCALVAHTVVHWLVVHKLHRPSVCLPESLCASDNVQVSVPFHKCPVAYVAIDYVQGLVSFYLCLATCVAVFKHQYPAPNITVYKRQSAGVRAPAPSVLPCVAMCKQQRASVIAMLPISLCARGYGGDPYSGTIIPQPPGGYLGGASSKAQAPGLQGQGSTASSTVSLQKGGDPTYPTSFHEVMEMVSKGITPPNVRTDIRDTPPDPSRPPSEAQISQRTKPWLQPQYGTTSPSSAFTSTATVDPVVMSGIPSPYLYSSFAGARSAAGPSGSAAPPQMPTASSARDLEQGVTRPAHTVQTGQQLGGASHLPFIPPQGSESAIGVGPTSGLPQISTGYPRSTSVGLGPQSGYEGPGTPGSSASSQPAFHPPSGHSPPMTGMAQLPPSGPSPPMMGMPPPPQQQQQPHLGGGLVDLADSQWGRLSASEPTTMSPSASVSAAGPMGSDGPTGAVTGAGPSGAGSSTLATPLVTSVARTPLTSMLPAGGHVGWRPPPLPQPTVVNQAKPAEARPQSSQANPAEVSPPPIPEPTIVNQAKPAEARPQSSQVNPAEVSPPPIPEPTIVNQAKPAEARPQSSQANPAEVSPPPIPEPTMVNQAKLAEASPQSSQANPAEVSPPPIPEPTMINQAKPAEASPQSSQANPAETPPFDQRPPPMQTSAVPEPIALSPVQKAGTSKAEFTTGAAGPSTSPGEASQPGAEEAGQVATE